MAGYVVTLYGEFAGELCGVERGSPDNANILFSVSPAYPTLMLNPLRASLTSVPTSFVASAFVQSSRQ